MNKNSQNSRRILHVVPGLAQLWNGIAGAAKDIAKYQREQGYEVDVVETKEFVKNGHPFLTLTSDLDLTSAPAEVWVHSNWWPPTLIACWKVIRAQKAIAHHSPPPPIFSTSSPRLVRMTHANLDPLRYRSKGWKKRLVAPFERWLYRRTARVVVTCEAEAEWCRAWGVRCPIEVFDLKRFYDLGVENRCRCRAEGESLRVLFLGRAGDPLKGVRFLEAAVAQITAGAVELRVVSNHFGDELEADWAWCDVLCLPTLSENFGLVVAEALSRGKRVITTDGAPAWAPEECGRSSESKSKSGEGDIHSTPTPSIYTSLVYLRGYRDGDDATRVRLLRDALREMIG